MLNLFHAAILGVVEGVTEFLPISSTAHLILTSELLKLEQTEYLKSFEIIIQLGAILAVVVLYWKRFLNWEIIKKLVVAFLPTGALGLIFYKIIKQFFLGNTTVVLGSLFIGGLFLILFEKFFQEKKHESDVSEISYKQCLQLGLFQSIAMIPGVSRSAATIVGGLILGIPRRTIVEFSFLLAVPTMLAATVLDLAKNYKNFSGSQFNFLAVGFIVSFLAAIVAIRWLINYIKKHNFIPFGIYRIIIAAVFAILLFK